MIKKITIRLLPFLVLLLSFASYPQQTHQLDSLLNVLRQSPDDSNKVKTLIALSKYYGGNNKAPEAKQYAQDAISLAEKTKWSNSIRNAYINLAGMHTAEANGCMRKGEYTEALKHYLTAFRLYEKYNDKTGVAWLNNNIGRLYWIQKNYPEAMKYYLKALKNFEEINDKNGIAAITNGIGIIYENQGNYSEALKYYYDVIRLYGEIGKKGSMINMYFNIGFLYEDQKKYPEALENHAAALKISEETGNKSGIAAAYSNMGDIYLKQQNFTESLKSYLLALKIYQELEHEEGIASSLISAGTVYIQLKDFQSANKNLNEGLMIAKKEGLLYTIKISYENLAKSDSLAGNWEQALDNYKQYVIYRDSLEGDEVNQRILKVQMQYDYERKEDSLKYQQALIDASLKQQILLSKQQKQDLLLKEQEVHLLGNEKRMQQLQIQKDSAETAGHKAEADKKQEQLTILNKEKAIQSLALKKQRQANNYLIAGIALFAILAFFVYRNYRTRQKLKMQTLRNKIAIDLHDDVGSTLSSISIFSQMALEESKEVRPMLQTIGESSRKMLDAMADIVWTISPENDQFEKIILRMRSFAYELLGAKKMEFRFVADKNIADIKLPMEARRNLYLIFKEATNNMVKYSGAHKAMFSIKEENDKLVMLIKDDGKGFDNNKVSEGNGLKNMKKRADEMGAILMIDSIPGNGTTIKLELAV